MEIKYVALGLTESFSDARRVVGRYKSHEELRDIYYIDSLEQLSKAARKELYIFRVVDRDSERALHMITFDLSGVRSGHVYSNIKECFYFSYCAKVDNSTYLCPSDTRCVEPIVEEYSAKHSGASYKIDSFLVEPLSQREVEFVRERLEATIKWLEAKMYMLCSNASRSKKAEEKALEAIETLKSIPRNVIEKLLAYGVKPINVEQFEKLVQIS